MYISTSPFGCSAKRSKSVTFGVYINCFESASHSPVLKFKTADSLNLVAIANAKVQDDRLNENVTPIPPGAAAHNIYISLTDV